jgi:hypothetical protein
MAQLTLHDLSVMRAGRDAGAVGAGGVREVRCVAFGVVSAQALVTGVAAEVP